MLTGLLLTALLMGLGGMPHCAAMCGAPCAAVLPRGVPLSALAGRCVGYAVLGLVASASAGLISRWGQQISMLQPIWLMLQVAAVLLGVWLLATGHMPQQVNALGHQAYMRFRQRVVGRRTEAGAMNRSLWMPFLAGMAWAALPCGLLYAALMVAALASEPWGGALVMLAFAIPSAVGVWAAPTLLAWLSRAYGKTSTPSNAASQPVPILWFKGGAAAKSIPLPGNETASADARLFDPRWAVRLAGLSLALTAAWAVSHQIIAQWRAWCA